MNTKEVTRNVVRIAGSLDVIIEAIRRLLQELGFSVEVKSWKNR